MIRSTHTFVELEISPAAYDEISSKLKAAGYEHCFCGATLDMQGIGLRKIVDVPMPNPVEIVGTHWIHRDPNDPDARFYRRSEVDRYIGKETL